MHQSITGEDRWRVNVERRIIIVRDAAAGFFNDQHARSYVPGLQTLFPKTVKAARRDVSQIECGSSVASHSLRVHDEAGKVPREFAALSHIVRKTGTKQRRRQIHCLRNAYAAAIKR